MLKVLCVCGARPNFMKIAPIVEMLSSLDGVDHRLVHTGQHYDKRMSRLFFGELSIPEPDVNLEVGSGSQAVQTAQVMTRFEPVCIEYQPDWVVVVGDVNSTLACALVAVKLGVKVAHVEAGLRSFDRTMPEEINRILTDAVSAALFVTEPAGVENLKHEGVPKEKIHFVGNVMIDTLLRFCEKANGSAIRETLALPGDYALVTLHRPSNVDHSETLSALVETLGEISETMPVVFPIHPRTRANLERCAVKRRLKDWPGLRMIEPLGYLDFLKLMGDARVVLTDSGGIQEETTILNVPCLTLRENTERPITIERGTNRLTGSSPDAILRAFGEVCEAPPGAVPPPELWDGQAAGRIVEILVGRNVHPPGKRGDRSSASCAALTGVDA